MPGGNTSSSKKGHRALKGGGQNAPDVKALSGAETFADEANMQLFGYNPEDYVDTTYGLDTFATSTPSGGGYRGNVSGYITEKPGTGIEHPGEQVGQPAPSRLSKPAKSSDPFPGGG